MFLVMENNEVCLAELFSSDVSFTVLKEKIIKVALQLISELGFSIRLKTEILQL